MFSTWKFIIAFVCKILTNCNVLNFCLFLFRSFLPAALMFTLNITMKVPILLRLTHRYGKIIFSLLQRIPWLFKGWNNLHVELSNRQVLIKPHYPLDSIIHLLKNSGQCFTIYMSDHNCIGKRHRISFDKSCCCLLVDHIILVHNSAVLISYLGLNSLNKLK